MRISIGMSHAIDQSVSPHGALGCFEIFIYERRIWIVSNLKGAAAGNCAENTLQNGLGRAFLSYGVWDPKLL